MLVKDIIEGYANKTVSRKELAEQHNVTIKTISNKIARLGYKWDRDAQRHKYVGDEAKREEIENTDFATLFEPNYVAPKQPKTSPVSKPDAVAGKDTKTQANKPVGSSNQAQSSLFDDIDEIAILLKQEKQEKTYRGFYIDNDVIAVLDKVADGNKSKIVSQSLRAVFKAQGLL